MQIFNELAYSCSSWFINALTRWYENVVASWYTNVVISWYTNVFNTLVYKWCNILV